MRIATFEWELGLNEIKLIKNKKQSISCINRLKMDCSLQLVENFNIHNQ